MFTQIGPDTFATLLGMFQERDQHAATSPFHDEIGTRYFHDGDAGYALRIDGELVLVHSFLPGRGNDIVTDAIARGATYLDCFDGYLPEFYARHGFQVNARVPNWTPGEPDVVYMSLNGYADRHGVEVVA